MPKYKVRGIGKDSGRSRSRTYTAKDEASARAKAEADGTAIDQIEELPPDPPTERQIAYAKDLRIRIPPDATKAELSDLISCKIDEDTTASPQLMKIANEYEVETSRYTGEASVYGQIFSVLSESGREQELAAWFASNVLNDRLGSRSKTAIVSPNDPQLNSVAGKLVADDKVMKSIKRYSGCSLLWFGERTGTDGYTLQGGSNRTAAYKAAAALVDQEFGLKSAATSSPRKPHSPRYAPAENAGAENKGPSISIIAIIVIVVLVVLGILL
ncbi:hypothetical protein [Halomonas ramblicola]|uniref:hypothetical protein n=1 Tax=Halomonas ramblicola TaxID=747349 RepID=UPI0025B53844|nr:hypothetical protein [Halomonas ramblicola]MDN3523081.1 hypothetical protein [Halomonas ramblicola]